jgi:biopolymer transport protein ExbD
MFTGGAKPMKRRLLYSQQNHVEEINISPLIDIVFILLIFFIVTAVFTKETGVDIDRPQALSSQEVDTRALIFSVTSKGQVYYDGREIGFRGVRSIVKRELRRKDRPVVIMVDKDALISDYTKIHDESALAGAKLISMATQR